MIDATSDVPLNGIKHKSTLFIFFICLNATISSFFVGYSLVYISTFQNFQTIMNIYDIEISNPAITQSIITGCVPVGAILGALLSSIFLKNLSRRFCFYVTNILALIGIIVNFVKIGPMIIIGRTILGICTGVYSSITPLYVNEILPFQLKNLATINQIMIASSQSFAFLFYFLLTVPGNLSDQHAYNFISNIFIILIVVQTALLIFVFPYQTPKYWLMKKEHDKCKQLLRVIYVEEFVEEVFANLLSTEQNVGQVDMLQSLKQTQRSSRYQESNYRMQSNTSMPRIAIFLAIHAALFQQLTGVNSVSLYGGKIVNEVLPSLNKIIPIFITFLPAIAAVFTTSLMKKFGRKTLLQVGGGLLILPLAMICIGFGIQPTTQSIGPKVLVVVALFLYMGIFGLTLGPIVWLIIPQFVEPRIVPYSTMANLIGAAICIIVFPIASQYLPNKAYLFQIYLIWGLGSLIINHKYLVQTKDKTRDQIYKQLKGQ